ncbi:MAG: Oxidoreductase molybdopterin binding [Frankiales bacterium]|nr:Oxidoreductase molybdopterin binding [Frankiales bacterium]
MVSSQSKGKPAKGKPASEGPPVGRRVILGLLGLGAVGVVTGRVTQDGLARVLGPIENRDPTGLVSLFPVGDSFRFYSVTGSVPSRSAADYRLTVSGLVDHPQTLTMADLAALPQTSFTSDFQCVTGWRVRQVEWSGVALARLLDEVGVRAQAKAVHFTSLDGTYTESLTIEQARLSDVIVATSMLGKPVTHDHGGPVRMYVGPMYGYKSIKWLSGIQLTEAVEVGYWETRGYDVDGFVGHSNGRDDEPTG